MYVCGAGPALAPSGCMYVCGAGPALAPSGCILWLWVGVGVGVAIGVQVGVCIRRDKGTRSYRYRGRGRGIRRGSSAGTMMVLLGSIITNRGSLGDATPQGTGVGGELSSGARCSTITGCQGLSYTPPYLSSGARCSTITGCQGAGLQFCSFRVWGRPGVVQGV